jgi:hypothetical protein
VGHWHYLSVIVFREYVLWRWAGPDGTVSDDRAVGPDRRNALSHLWWVAELGRNGDDYSPVVDACAMQETLVTLTDILAPQNRAAALAFIRFVSSGPGGRRRGAKDVQQFRRALNHCLSTYMLDAAAPDPGPDPEAADVWIHTEPDHSHLIGDGPIDGPPEARVPEEHIRAVMDQLYSIERQLIDLNLLRTPRSTVDN